MTDETTSLLLCSMDGVQKNTVWTALPDRMAFFECGSCLPLEHFLLLCRPTEVGINYLKAIL